MKFCERKKYLMLDQNLNFIKTQMMIMTTHRIKLDVPDVIPSEAILQIPYVATRRANKAGPTVAPARPTNGAANAWRFFLSFSARPLANIGAGRTKRAIQKKQIQDFLFIIFCKIRMGNLRIERNPTMIKLMSMVIRYVLRQNTNQLYYLSVCSS